MISHYKMFYTKVRSVYTICLYIYITDTRKPAKVHSLLLGESIFEEQHIIFITVVNCELKSTARGIDSQTKNVENMLQFSLI